MTFQNLNQLEAQLVSNQLAKLSGHADPLLPNQENLAKSKLKIKEQLNIRKL